MGGDKERLALWAKESLECCKYSLMVDSCSSSRDNNVDRNADSKGQVQEVAFGNKQGKV